MDLFDLFSPSWLAYVEEEEEEEEHQLSGGVPEQLPDNLCLHEHTLSRFPMSCAFSLSLSLLSIYLSSR